LVTVPIPLQTRSILFPYTTLFRSKPRLTSGYYDSKKWENEGITYKRFGVDGFRRILVWVGWEKLNKISNPVKKKLDALKHLEYRSESTRLNSSHVKIAYAVFCLKK